MQIPTITCESGLGAAVVCGYECASKSVRVTELLLACTPTAVTAVRDMVSPAMLIRKQPYGPPGLHNNSVQGCQDTVTHFKTKCSQ